MSVTVYKTAGYDAAKSVDIHPTADLVLIAAKVEAGKHIHSGAYISRLSVQRATSHEVVQWHIVAADPEADNIEFPHRIVQNGVDTGRFTRGTYILNNAARRVV